MSSKNKIDVHVGGRLRMARLSAGLDVDGLVEILAYSVSAHDIAAYESGSARILPSKMLEISKALGVEVVYFFEGLNDLQGR